MPWSRQSRRNLSTCHPDLQRVFNLVDELGYECTVIEGHRGKKRQNACYPKKSRVKWPDSPHNRTPSDAADVGPYVDGKLSWDWRHCIFFAGVVLAVAATMDIQIACGGELCYTTERTFITNF